MLQKIFPRAIVIVAATTALAVAQIDPGTPTSIPTRFRFAGQPFSAREEIETVQTLTDGTRITNGTQKVMHYRDSLGRTRTERTMQPSGFSGASVPAPSVYIEIIDPVGGYIYSFDSNGHTAHRLVLSMERIGKVLAPQNTKGGVAPADDLNAQQPHPEVSKEQLGTQTIEGLLTQGARVTTTFPIGFLGNDRPVATITETWVSPEIGITVLMKTSDPRRGESTMKVTNISRAEPDPSLFQPPAGYEIVGPEGAPPVPPPPPAVR